MESRCRDAAGSGSGRGSNDRLGGGFGAGARTREDNLTMDLSTDYLGFHLPHPFMPGSSPLVDDLDMVKRLEDAGAAAIVMHSLFEEQIVGEELAQYDAVKRPGESYGEALSYLPDPEEFALGAHDYLQQVSLIKAAVSIPVIASLNGTTPSSWIEYARLMEQAGADALEVNVYDLATDPLETGEDVEQRVLDIVTSMREAVRIPLAVKLSPFYSSLSNLARRLEHAGASGLVLFNRFYQPDIDIEELEVVPKLYLSSPNELLLRLRWLAILSTQFQGSLAVTGGVHNAPDAIKAVMAGAHAVQMVSVLLRRGPETLVRIRADVERWLEIHEYESLKQMQGSMSYARTANPKEFERANYMRILQGWRPFEDVS
jgi:dihydroorotate dehydrogenase (fumarate)